MAMRRDDVVQKARKATGTICRDIDARSIFQMESEVALKDKIELFA